MTEKKIEILFNEAIVVGDLLERNLQEFDKNHQSIKEVYANMDQLTQIIKQISLYDQKIKHEEAQKFSREIKEQVDRYYAALQEVNLDTTAIENMIETYNATILKQINRLEESAQTISQTLHKNGDAIIAATGLLKKSKIGMTWSVTMFGTGVIAGALFLSAYPIAQAAKTFHAQIKKQDEAIQELKEQYETNNKILEFLRKNNITIDYGITDDSWEKRSMQFAPMVLLPKNSVIRTDEINGYRRIIFKKTEINNSF